MGMRVETPAWGIGDRPEAGALGYRVLRGHWGVADVPAVCEGPEPQTEIGEVVCGQVPGEMAQHPLVLVAA